MVTVPTWITYDKAPDKPPALVGPKVVLPRLGYKVFWGRMSSMFHVCVGAHFFAGIRKYGNTDPNSVFYHANLGVIRFI
jgi:hypothetical protein